MTTRRVVGCMTGTSIDALDAALVEITGRGLSMSARALRTHTAPLADLAPRLRSLAEQHPTTAADIAALAHDFSLLHARAIRELVAGESADLVCVHGQTIFHAPPLSWQLINAPVIARELSIPVVFDLRSADLAAGGQGAPITPIADWILFRAPEPVALVNLGGFCNVTMLPGHCKSPDQVQGFDVCACNHLLDAVARHALHRPFDDGGREALAGRPSPPALASLLALLSQQSRSGRSLGTGDELNDWIIRAARDCSPQDLAATACAAIGGLIRSRLGATTRLLLAGGGTNNRALAIAIGGESVATTDSRGIPASHREAICFAVLGALCQDRVPITLPQVTRVPAPAPISGCWAHPA